MCCGSGRKVVGIVTNGDGSGGLSDDRDDAEQQHISTTKKTSTPKPPKTPNLKKLSTPTHLPEQLLTATTGRGREVDVDVVVLS